MIPPDLPALIGGKYRPLQVIGEGAMGIVYSVEHAQTGELLALKVMTAHHGATRDAIERFKREARASAKIKSEHVVRIIDADVAPELDRAPYLVMDLLDGYDLEKASGDVALAPAVVVEWLRQISRALDKAHRIGVTHRDLKPENLFLTQREDGTPLIKILDFGIAKISAESTGTTQSGQILGTPLYMSPEQARGDAGMIGPSSDLYALGLIAYKLLTGSPYWNATSVAGIIGQVLYEPMVPPSARSCPLGPEFDKWFLRACNRQPPNRFASATEQVEALARVLGLPFDARPETLRSNPGDSGNALAERPLGHGSGADAHAHALGASSGSRAAHAIGASSGSRDGVSPGQGETLVSSSKEMPELRMIVATKRRRTVFYAVMSAATLLSILVVLLYRREAVPPMTVVRPVVATSNMAGAAAALLPPVAPEPANLAIVEPPSSAEPKLAAGPVAPASATKRRDLSRPLPVKTLASAPAPIRSDKALVNDPLGDQK